MEASEIRVWWNTTGILSAVDNLGRKVYYFKETYQNAFEVPESIVYDLVNQFIKGYSISKAPLLIKQGAGHWPNIPNSRTKIWLFKIGEGI